MAELSELLSSQEPTEALPSSVHCEFVTGSAGSGKTYLIKKRIAEDPNYGVLASTTGIGAINVGGITLNSLLRYFDTASMADRLQRIVSILAGIAQRKRNIIIDEVSMMDSLQLDYLFQAVEAANEYASVKEPMGIVLVGDYLQLPPIKAKFAFRADCWPHFERNTVKLDKIWRQESPGFLDAINFARVGDGPNAADKLVQLGVEFANSPDNDYRGTTIIAKNDQVDIYNGARLAQVSGKLIGLKSELWGDAPNEWRKNIPEVLKVKVGALVMILKNETQGFTYVNGDTGYITEITPGGAVVVKLNRTSEEVEIYPEVRNFAVSEKAALERGIGRKAITHVYCTCPRTEFFGDRDIEVPWGGPSYNCKQDTYNVAGIRYYPLRLAWATTTYKSQGLTLDRVQIDCRDQFFGSFAQAYVALSRARTPEGLRIVGSPGKLAERIRRHPEVGRFV